MILVNPEASLPATPIFHAQSFTTTGMFCVVVKNGESMVFLTLCRLI